MHPGGVNFIVFYILYTTFQFLNSRFILSEKVENHYNDKNFGYFGNDTDTLPYKDKLNEDLQNIKEKYKYEDYLTPRYRLKVPTFKEKIFVIGEVKNDTKATKPLTTKPSKYYLFVDKKYGELESDSLYFVPYRKKVYEAVPEYYWETDNKNLTKIDYKNLNLEYLYGRALYTSYPEEMYSVNKSRDLEILNKFINGTRKKSMGFNVGKNDYDKNTYQIKYIDGPNEYKDQNRFNNEVIRKLTLSKLDPIHVIQEKEVQFHNMRWSPYLENKIPIGIPEQIINFDYDNEIDEDEFYSKKGDLFKRFLAIASDFSFLSGSTLNAAVCMYKAVLPLMLIRWKSVNSITNSRLDSIIKITMGIPFFKYFEEKENMINVCVNMFHTTDIGAYEGLGLGKKSFESSIIGISVSDFKVYQYFVNKRRSNETVSANKRPNDSANLLEMVYDDICHYFYECMDEDLKESIDDYVFNKSHIFDVEENKIGVLQEISNIPLFPDILERRTSINSLPSDKFIASFHEMSYINFDLPEMSFPGMNIRDMCRLYYYSGKIGLKLPLRLIIKMTYEISNFANHSALLRQTYCTESLLKITNFKLSEVICNIAFMYVPTNVHDSNVFFTVNDIEKRVLASPSKRRLRPNPIYSDAELNSLKSPEILYVPDFIQFKVTQDKWMLYRSLSIQLYGSIEVENGDSVSSIISLIHSAVLGYIKLNWEEFKEFYTMFGVLNPELYYSLLLNNSRGPALIELIAFYRIYQIPIKIYSKRIEYDPELRIEFRLEKELTELIDDLGKVKHKDENSSDKYFEGNTNKLVSCKIIRLLVDYRIPTGYYKDVFTAENDIIPEEARITNNVRDKSNFIWDSILPLYDERTNNQIISKEAGIKVNYRTIDSDFLNDVDKGVKFENKNRLDDEETNHFDNVQRESELRRHSNYTYGRIFINTEKVPKQREDISDRRLQYSNIRNDSDEVNIKYLNQYSIIVQPLISFLEAGVYESRMFMYKIFESIPLFNWDKLQETINLEFLQNIIYIGDTNAQNNKADYKKVEEQKQVNKKLESNKETDIADYSANEIDDNKKITSNNMEEYKNELIRSKLMNLNSSLESLEKKNRFVGEEPEIELKVLNTPKSNMELTPVFLPTKKPWNGQINLSKYGLASEEPSFSFIPFSGSLPKPKPINETLKKIDLNLNILFNIARDHWMLPLDTISTVFFCFANSISPYLFNPDPNYIPPMVVYDKIVSTVISQLPIIDKNSNVRPIAFVVTVCEMALLDPIDLNQFLFIENENIESKNKDTPKSLIKVVGRIQLVKEICATFSSCLTNEYYYNDINRLSSQKSISAIYNQLTPENSNIIQMQELIPRFPEVSIISKNLFRMVYYIGRKGISIEKEALYQIAKELAISMHSISPFIWKSKIELEDYDDFNYTKRKNELQRCSYIPTYEEAYWNNFDRQLILNTCASILTTRGVVSYPSAMVICHYSFIRVPLSRFGISNSIPTDEDLIEDERVSMHSVSFYLRNVVEDPIKLVKSVEYNKDPMKFFIDIFTGFEGEDLVDWNEEMKVQFRSFFNSEYVSEIYVKYDDFVKYFLEQGGNLIEREILFERKDTKRYNSEIGFQDEFPKSGFRNLGKFGRKVLNKLNEFNGGHKEKFSSFWGYKPEPYKKNLNKSTFESPIDDIFESVSLLLYGTNTYRSIIKSTILSALSLVEKVCEIENDIIKKFTTKDVYINVEGVDKDVVSYVFEFCEKQRLKKYIKDEHLEHFYKGSGMKHINIFELVQFIYKVPIMVFEMDNNSKFVRDTEINQRLFDSVNNKSLLYSIKIAKILDGTRQSFKYQPLIPKVYIEDFFYLKDGVGPIPHMVMARTISLTKRKNKKYTSWRLRRTLFDNAVENYYNRKKPSDFFQKMKPEGRFHQEFIPILRKFLPFSPGEMEGNRLLQLVKTVTAITDLKRRPIKELPDLNMEKSLKSLLLNGGLEDQKNKLINNYGINFDELVNKDGLFGFNVINEERYKEFMNKINYEKFLSEKPGLYPIRTKFNPQIYKFILDYYTYVKNSKVDPTLLEAILEAGKHVKPFKKEREDSENEEINEMIKFSAMSIFSELYHYWNEFMLKLNNFYYNAKYNLGFGYTKEEKEDLIMEKNIKKYIKNGIEGINKLDNVQKQTTLGIGQKRKKII
ncbi:hypothetical protein FG386_003640 [Cryptosporidium ryanae]|uniref:uncharacterized protein n=1 Tax=Cryptosporidium ryanae TaxID=515981 RepID=UPI00351A2EF4|nr:hypothetical protein FG386_003640 [Cryptosporidium ryanae]